MPIDLTKVINDPTTAKPKFVPSYFQSKLTGKGKVAGLFNQSNTIVKDNIDFYINPKTNEVDVPFNNHLRTLLYQSFESNYQYTEALHQKHYEQKSNHNYDLSPLNVMENISEYVVQNDDNLKTTFEKAPAFLTDALTKEIGQNQYGDRLSVGLIAGSINYKKFVEQTGYKDSIENFYIKSSLLVKIENDQATKTNVHIVNNIEDFILHGPLALMQQNHAASQTNEIFVFNGIDIYNLLLNDQSDEHKNYALVLQNIDSQYNFTHFTNLPTNSKLFDDVIKYLNTANFVDIISRQAKLNHDHLLTDLAKLFQFYDNDVEQFREHKAILIFSYHLIKLEESNYNDQDYQDLYRAIEKTTLHNPKLNADHQYTPFKFSKLISVNTRLSLTHELAQLNNNSQVHQFNPTEPFVTNKVYSPEQLDVIKTTDPYSIVVAGAGSGKSHTLLGRLTYLVENHINLKNVLVTSFTNTAAQNIITRFGGDINSLTNANLFHKIYQNNFDHELTNDDTIVNMMNIISDTSRLMQKTPTIKDTKHRLTKYISQTINQGFRRIDMQEITENLISLINDRLDDVIKILDGISQTSLLLEPIIINALMQNQVAIDYPDELSDLDFIITDESQDTSTFEYVLLLQLAQRNNAQLMIIGDSNQTLYEFRNANPDFLNALERSETFKTYQMSTNYRSQQSILSMTNQILDVLKTNKSSKLQLHANQYVNLTPQNFKDHVQIANVIIQPKSNRSNNIKNEITESILNRQDIVDWVIDRFKTGKQIAIMAFRNNDTQAIGDAVAKIIQDTFDQEPTVGFTRKQQPRSNTWLSQMMSQTRDEKFEMKVKQGNVSALDLYNSLKDRLQVIADQKYYDKGNINNWALMKVQDVVRSPFIQASLNELNHHKLSLQKFQGSLALSLIKEENARNNMSRLLQSQTDDTDWEHADIVVSTIHSAKGLEFPSVICYYDETMKNAASQENLRLYGVALTRAKENELIINRPKLKHSGLNALPTNFGYNQSDMFKTPMRTGYERVLQILNKPNHPNTTSDD